MKLEDIVLGSKNIVLGVFSTDTFRWVKLNLPVLTYSAFDDLIGDIPNWDDGKIIDIVSKAAYKADKIVFILDDVHFPIDIQQSITCEELQLICDNEELFNKTIFVKGDNVINFDKNIL